MATIETIGAPNERASAHRSVSVERTISTFLFREIVPVWPIFSPRPFIDSLFCEARQRLIGLLFLAQSLFQQLGRVIFAQLLRPSLASRSAQFRNAQQLARRK
jgi:hypothetical protein